MSYTKEELEKAIGSKVRIIMTDGTPVNFVIEGIRLRTNQFGEPELDLDLIGEKNETHQWCCQPHQTK
jgi:hypothetical protein